jgi:beta-lactamase regulating signal transducer with metallopeptidase domain
MNPFLSMGVGEMWQLAGWTMVHFLWLGALVGVAAAVSRLVLRRASANVRYVVALAWLVVLVALPVGIAAWIGAKPQAVLPAYQHAGVQELPIVELNATPMPIATAPANVVDAPTFAPSATTDLPPKSSTISDLLPQLEPIIAASARYLPWLWIIGTPLTFLLLTTGIVGAERLRRASRAIDDGPIAAACARLCESLCIGRRVTVGVCERIAAPVLVGIVRPIILLPPAALTGWSPDEIEMVLLHELAHVRRWDNLVNLAQRIVESLLFFHPVVWLVSTWVRREREACCDAVVVDRTDRPHAYAEMLVALAAEMPRSVLFHPAATSAMAAGPLRGRIRRILGLDDDPMLVSGKSLGMVMSGLLLAATILALGFSTRGQAEETDANSSASQDLENAAATPDVSNESGANRSDFRSKFVATAENPLETRTYDIADAPETKLRLDWLTDMLNRPSAGPKPTFGYNWTHDWTRLEIVAPREGQEFIKPQILDQASLSDRTADTTRFSKRLQAEQSTRESTESNRDLGDRQAQEARTQNNLKDLAISLLNFHEATKYLPPAAKLDADGKPLLSWRVLVLPYLGQDEAKLFEEFHLDEPWDSEHNRRLIGRMPKVFENPKLDRVGMTNYLAVVGPACVFTGTPQGIRITQISDGTSKTIALVEANEDRAVEWTKPQDWEFDRQNPTAGLGSLWKDHWYGAWIDGSVRRVEKREAADAVGIQFTRAGREATSLRESEGRGATQGRWAMADRYGGMAGLADGGFSDESELGGEFGIQPAAPPRKFPPLEEQKLADLAWKRLGLELEPLGEEDLQRVKALGYDGGLKVTHGAQDIKWSDILVGLHVWPTRSLQELAEVLNRPDLGELAPLKFYVIRKVSTDNGTMLGAEKDKVITGRIDVGVDYVTQPVYAQPTDMPAPVAPPTAPVLPPPTGRMLPTSRATASPKVSDTPTSHTSQPLAPGRTGSIHPGNDGRAQLVGNGLVYLFDSDEAHSRDVDDTISQLRDTYALDIWVVDARVNPEVANSFEVSNFPSTVLFKDGKKEIQIDGKISENSVRILILSAFGADAVVKRSTGQNTAPLRYEGRTFDTWRDMWRTELSTEKRIGAVNALAAFGRAGYGKEATEAILDVAGDYDFAVVDDTQAAALQRWVLNVLAPENRRSVLVEYWLPELTERVKKDPAKWKWLAVHLLGRLHTDDPATLAQLQSLVATGPAELRQAALEALVRSSQSRHGPGQLDDTTRKLLASALKSDDLARVRGAIPLLIFNAPTSGGDMGWRTQLILQPELIPLLFDSDESLRREVRGMLRHVKEEDAPQVTKLLLDTIRDESRARDHLQVIRALTAMGKQARGVRDELLRVINNNKDPGVSIAALVALLFTTPGLPLNDPLDEGSLSMALSQFSSNYLSEAERDTLRGRLGKSEDLYPQLLREANSIFPQRRESPGGGFF